MAINPSFLNSYEELTKAVETGVDADTKGCLQDWLDEIDNEPIVAPMIQKLQEALDIDGWWIANVEANYPRQELQWPDNPCEAIGMKMLLMCAFGVAQLSCGLLDCSRQGRPKWRNGLPKNFRFSGSISKIGCWSVLLSFWLGSQLPGCGSV